MSAFAIKAAAAAHVPMEVLERLAGGDLSEVLLVRRGHGDVLVAKGGPAVAAEAAMLRALQAIGMPVPNVEGEHGDVLLMQFIANDGIFSIKAWAEEHYGWPVNYRLGTVEIDNRERTDWLAFWGEQRLAATASVLDRPWRERVDRLARRLPDVLPAAPPASLLHGDLWSGNILVADGALAALIDPACYHGDAEVDLAMLTLFDTPPDTFWDAYGRREPGWEERRRAYQLFPALVHLRLFGASYGGMVDRLLHSLGA
jgi:fructosamine-3-kinase